jgi:hypothetical protein
MKNQAKTLQQNYMGTKTNPYNSLVTWRINQFPKPTKTTHTLDTLITTHKEIPLKKQGGKMRTTHQAAVKTFLVPPHFLLLLLRYSFILLILPPYLSSMHIISLLEKVKKIYFAKRASESTKTSGWLG